MHTTVDSVLIHSPDPVRLREWYVSITGGTPEGDALVHLGDTHLVIVDPDGNYVQLVQHIPADESAGSPT